MGIFHLFYKPWESKVIKKKITLNEKIKEGEKQGKNIKK